MREGSLACVEVRDQHRASFHLVFRDKISHWTWSSPTGSWLISKSLGADCLHPSPPLPSPMVTGMCCICVDVNTGPHTRTISILPTGSSPYPPLVYLGGTSSPIFLVFTVLKGTGTISLSLCLLPHGERFKWQPKWTHFVVVFVVVAAILSSQMWVHFSLSRHLARDAELACSW